MHRDTRVQVYRVRHPPVPVCKPHKSKVVNAPCIVFAVHTCLFLPVLGAHLLI